MDMTDVRKALWRAYEKLGIEEKRILMEDDYCELQYLSLEDVGYNEEKYLRPNCIVMYSPTLFPNGTCYIKKGDEECKINRFCWHSPDIFNKAVELIGSCANNLEKRVKKGRAYAKNKNIQRNRRLEI